MIWHDWAPGWSTLFGATRKAWTVVINEGDVTLDDVKVFIVDVKYPERPDVPADDELTFHSSPFIGSPLERISEDSSLLAYDRTHHELSFRAVTEQDGMKTLDLAGTTVHMEASGL